MTRPREIHEDYVRERDAAVGGNRAFGLVIAVAFVIIATFPLLDSNPVRIWAVVVAAFMLAAALLTPGVLAPLNRLWHAFGVLLHRIVTPIVLVLVFSVFVIVGRIRRVFLKDPLALQFDRSAGTYWITRLHRPDMGSLRRQF